MFLPTKHISLENSYLGMGRTVLRAIGEPVEVMTLWRRIEGRPNIGTAARFFETLDFLFMIGAVEFKDGLIGKVGD